MERTYGDFLVFRITFQTPYNYESFEYSGRVLYFGSMDLANGEIFAYIVAVVNWDHGQPSHNNQFFPFS